MRRLPLPPKLAEKAREYAAGERTPVEPKDAATVILLRPGTDDPLVYLLRRQTSMAFAGGMCVFPGGGVDSRDFDPETAEAWAGPSPEQWAERLGTDAALARALICAAVRETFEESGVLLAGPSPDQVVADTTAEDWEADRVALETRQLSMTDFLRRRGLVLRTDLLGVFAAWTTPVFEPRRFRTWFFVAEVPEGQRTRDVSTESDEVLWLPVSDALTRVEGGEIMMMPPTYFTCLEVAEYPTPGALLSDLAGRRVEMFTPEVIDTDGEVTLSSPPGADERLARRS